MSVSQRASLSETWSRRDFERSYAANVCDVHAYVARRVRGGQVEDLTAQVFAEAWCHRDRFDPARGSDRGWIFGIAANVVRRHLRAEGSRSRAMARIGSGGGGVVVGEDDDAVRRVDQPATLRALAHALEKLGETDQEIVVMAAFTDLTMEEMAHIFTMRVGTLKSRLSRARSRLRAELGAEQEGVSTRD